MDKGSGRTAEQPAVVEKRGNWGTKIVLVLVTLVLLALLVLLAITWLPRAWAIQVGQISDESIMVNGFAGFACGLVFTAVPLLMLRRVLRLHGGLAGRVVWLILAALFAAPNLTTLGIVLGTGNSAHAAERTLDVDAPGFRLGSVIGAVVAALLVLMFWVLMGNRHRRKKQLHVRDAEIEQLRHEVKRREAESRTSPEPPSGDHGAPEEKPH